jgi:hypothetical protein
MILIQTVAAVWIVSAIRTTLEVQGGEIKMLRERWHDLAPKVMIVDSHEKRIEDHEGRLRTLETLRSEMERRFLEIETARIALKHGYSE